jgi:uncharacterized protein YwgA
MPDLKKLSRLSRLAWLIKHLDIPIEKMSDPEALEEHLRVQKAVFFLKCKKVSPFTQYRFDIYLRGPYSTELEKDWHEIADVKAEPVDLGNTGKQLEEFLQHSSEWLEIASHIIYLQKELNYNEIFTVLKLSKPWLSWSQYDDIYDEVRRLLS